MPQERERNLFMPHLSMPSRDQFRWLDKGLRKEDGSNIKRPCNDQEDQGTFEIPMQRDLHEICGMGFMG